MALMTARCRSLHSSGGAAQTKAHPQRQHRQHHGDHNRERENRRVVAQHRRHAHGRHAGVVHGADACADGNAAADQLPGPEVAPRDQPERQGRSGDARQQRPERNGPVVADRAEAEGQHADEVHRPDAGTERQAAGHQRHGAQPQVALLAGHLRQPQRHARSKDRQDYGQRHEQRVIGAGRKQAGVARRREQRVETGQIHRAVIRNAAHPY